MAETVTKYKIFLASPSDVSEERDSIKDVIDELNKTYCNRINIVLELLKWETDSAPGINGNSIQDIIDGDIGNNYDIFIGLLFKKFGTQTQKYGSGTEQEFQNAFERFRKDKNSIQILFYFKNTQININEIDPIELSKIRNFKNSLGEKNTLYWEYDTSSNLQKYLRAHIPIRIESLIKSNKGGNIIVKEIEEGKELINEELGLLDYQDIYENSFAEAFKATGKMTEIITDFGKDMTNKVEEINLLNLRGVNISIKERRRIFQSTARVFDKLSLGFNEEVPRYFNNFETGTDALEKMVMIYRTVIDSKSTQEVSDLIDQIDTLINAICLSLIHI